MSKFLLALLLAATLCSKCRCQDKPVPVTLTPLIGDTLYDADRDYFRLLADVAGFQWAVFTVDSDTVVTAKVCIIRDGIMDFTSVRMGSLTMLRKRLDDIQKVKTAARHRPGGFFLTTGLARRTNGNDIGSSRGLVSLKLEIGYNINSWLAVGATIDGYDPTQQFSISLMIAFYPPLNTGTIEPYVYYNPRPFGTLLRFADNYSQSFGIGAALPLGRSGIRVRAGAVVLLTTVDNHRWIYVSPYDYPVRQDLFAHKTVGIAELSVEIPY